MGLPEGWLVNILVSGTHSALTSLVTRTPTGQDVKAEDLQELLDRDPTEIESTMTRAFSAVGGMVGSPFGLLPMLSTLYSSGRGQEHSQIAMRTFLPNKIPPETYAKLVFKHYISEQTDEAWRRDLAFQGWSPERVDALVESYRALYNLNDIRGLFLRGMLGEGEEAKAKAVSLITKYGYTDEEANNLIELFYYIPSPQDLVSWAAREVYEPEMIEKYGLDDEFEGLDLRDFNKAGVNTVQARNFWRAHWQHASYNQMIEMLHRGLVTEKDLYDWYRVVEIVPHWRENLTQIAYTPFTRVDIRRMYRLGVLDDFGVFKANAAIGYRPYVIEHEHTSIEEAFSCEACRTQSPAGAMLEFTKKYYPLDDDTDDKEVRQLTKAEILRGYREHIIDYDMALGALQSIDYSEDIAAYHILLEDVKLSEEETQEEITFITEKYKNGLMTDEDLIARLGSLDLSGEQQDYYTVKIQRYRDYNIRRPTLADFKRWFKMGIINETIFQEELMLEGYTSEHILNYTKEVRSGITED